MDDPNTIQPMNGRPAYEPGDADAFYAHVGSGGKVEADDWMTDDYRAAVLKFVEMHANSELMGVLPERDWIMRAPTLRRKLALTSKIQDEVGHAQLLYRVAEDLGKPRTDDAAGPARRQDEVPQRLPLPDAQLGRRRDHRLARRCRGDRLPAGAARLLLRAVRADDEEDLLGGVRPHHARARRRPDPDERDRYAARHGAGGARPVVGPADADAWPADRSGEGQGPALEHQEQEQRAAAPGVPLDLRAAHPRAGPARSRIRTCGFDEADGRWLVHRARLGGAEVGRHRPRSGVAGAPRLPARQLRRDAVGPRRAPGDAQPQPDGSGRRVMGASEYDALGRHGIYR